MERDEIHQKMAKHLESITKQPVEIVERDDGRAFFLVGPEAETKPTKHPGDKSQGAQQLLTTGASLENHGASFHFDQDKHRFVYDPYNGDGALATGNRADMSRGEQDTADMHQSRLESQLKHLEKRDEESGRGLNNTLREMISESLGKRSEIEEIMATPSQPGGGPDETKDGEKKRFFPEVMAERQKFEEEKARQENENKPEPEAPKENPQAAKDPAAAEPAREQPAPSSPSMSADTARTFLDKNNDGVLSPEELKPVADKLMDKNNDRVISEAERLAVLDTNKDGKVSPAEAEALNDQIRATLNPAVPVPEVNAPRAEAAHEIPEASKDVAHARNVVDKNHDGKLSRKELKPVAIKMMDESGNGKASKAERLAAMDKNHDGVVSRHERKSYFKQIKEALTEDKHEPARPSEREHPHKNPEAHRDHSEKSVAEFSKNSSPEDRAQFNAKVLAAVSSLEKSGMKNDMNNSAQHARQAENVAPAQVASKSQDNKQETSRH